MTALLTWLKLIPSLIAFVIGTVHSIEQGFADVAAATGNSAAKAGAAKLSLLENAMNAFLAGVGSLGIDPTSIVNIAKTIAGLVVTAFNSLGWFKSTSAPPVA